jgi:three-Cys-motif partner protein
MKLDKGYEGREHSAVKHALLRGYLEKLLFIKGMTGTQEITYVDCFAGPYKDESEDIQATSIAISLGILKKVRDALAAKKKYVTLRAIYVEENKGRYSRLESYLNNNSPSGIQTFPIFGDYSEKADEILRQCGDSGFTFFFVDPLGWTDVGIPRLRKLLERPKSEFLITFMYDHLNRFVKKADLRKQTSDLLGLLSEVDYENISSSQPKEREEFIVRKYREQIMAAMGAANGLRARSYHAVIKDKDKDRTKYHLVYGTRHHKGIIELADQSEKAELVQRVVRIQVKQNASLQESLFTPEEEAEHLEDTRTELEAVKAYWLTNLSDQAVAFDEERLADMLEETGWFIGDFQRAFKELLTENKVENLNGNSRRTSCPVYFKEGDQFRRCV